jgi:hypothetical protein
MTMDAIQIRVMAEMIATMTTVDSVVMLCRRYGRREVVTRLILSRAFVAWTTGFPGTHSSCVQAISGRHSSRSSRRWMHQFVLWPGYCAGSSATSARRVFVRQRLRLNSPGSSHVYAPYVSLSGHGVSRLARVFGTSKGGSPISDRISTHLAYGGRADSVLACSLRRRNRGRN